MNRVTRALSLAVFLSAAAAASGYAASADELAIKNYTLTLDKVTRYGAAVAALEQAEKTDPAIAAESEAVENANTETQAQLRALLLQHPKLFAFFQRQGLSVDDALLLPQALAGAYAAIESGMPEQFADFISPAQIAFVRQNKAVVDKVFATITNQ